METIVFDEAQFFGNHNDDIATIHGERSTEMNPISFISKFIKGFIRWYFYLGLYCLVLGGLLNILDFYSLDEFGIFLFPLFFIPLLHSISAPLRAFKMREWGYSLGLVSAWSSNLLIYIFAIVLSNIFQFHPVSFDNIGLPFLGVPFFVPFFVGNPFG